MLSVTSNKVQLIKLICNKLPANLKESQIRTGNNHSFLIIGPDPVPVQVYMGVVIKRVDLRITHEEADTMMPSIAVHMFNTEGKSTVHVFVEDTDVFVLLAHFFHILDIKGSLLMIPFSSSATVTDIGETVVKHASIIPHLLSLHALTGCDTVPSLKNIGKPKAMKALKDGVQPPILGEGNPDYKQATKFIAKCYRITGDVTDMSATRYPAWRSKTKSKVKSFKLEDLPPTTESFQQNVLRAELQAAIWRASLQYEPTPLDPTAFGWRKDEDNKILLPVFSTSDISQLPSKLEKLMACNCAGDSPCSKGQCGCRQSNRPCSIFCRCYGKTCHSPFIRSASTVDEEH